MFLGLLDPVPDPLVGGMDPVPSIILLSLSKNSKTLIPSVLLLLLDFLSLKNDVDVPSKSIKQNNFFFKFVFGWRLEGQ
jgi:hypothetical protein